MNKLDEIFKTLSNLGISTEEALKCLVKLREKEENRYLTKDKEVN